MSEVEIEQQTAEWLEYRRTRIGGSDAPIIMGDSPFMTPHQLWKQKRGLAPGFEGNFATRRGNRFEPVMRSLYELETGLELPPAVLVHSRYDFLIASMDGYSPSEKIGFETKVTGKEVYDYACKNQVHPKYIAQVQHQLEVTQAHENHFVVGLAGRDKYTGEDKIVDMKIVKAKRDEMYIEEKLLPAEIEFHRHMVDGTEPALTKDDVIEVDDEKAFELVKAKKIDKAELIKLLTGKYEHTNFSVLGTKLMKDVNGVWRLTTKKEVKRAA